MSRSTEASKSATTVSSGKSRAITIRPKARAPGRPKSGIETSPAGFTVPEWMHHTLKEVADFYEKSMTDLIHDMLDRYFLDRQHRRVWQSVGAVAEFKENVDKRPTPGRQKLEDGAVASHMRIMMETKRYSRLEELLDKEPPKGLAGRHKSLPKLTLSLLMRFIVEYNLEAMEILVPLDQKVSATA